MEQTPPELVMSVEKMTSNQFWLTFSQVIFARSIRKCGSWNNTLIKPSDTPEHVLEWSR